MSLLQVALPLLAAAAGRGILKDVGCLTCCHRFYAKSSTATRTKGRKGEVQDTTAVAGPTHAGDSNELSTGAPQTAQAGPSSEKVQNLDAVIKMINKKHGLNTIMRLGEAPLQIERIPSGCYMLDIALGGGWPKGRLIEVYGLESSGKTTLALAAIAQVQRAGGQAVLVDAEYAFNQVYAQVSQ
eukprot:jgi/Chrzof1/242/Cz01g08150.t1